MLGICTYCSSSDTYATDKVATLFHMTRIVKNSMVELIWIFVCLVYYSSFIMPQIFINNLGSISISLKFYPGANTIIDSMPGTPLVNLPFFTATPGHWWIWTGPYNIYLLSRSKSIWKKSFMKVIVLLERLRLNMVWPSSSLELPLYRISDIENS